MCHDLNLALTLLADLHRVAQVADSAIDLNAVVKELLKGSHVEDLVRRWLGGIDGELSQPR